MNVVMAGGYPVTDILSRRAHGRNAETNPSGTEVLGLREGHRTARCGKLEVQKQTYFRLAAACEKRRNKAKSSRRMKEFTKNVTL